MLARSEAGFTLIDALVGSIIVVLASVGIMTGLQVASRTSADQQYRTQAAELAHQDQERLRGLTAQQLDSVDQTRTLTVDGTAFAISSTGEYLSNATGGSSCTASGTAAASYIKIVSSVTWPANRRPPVVEQSIVTPPAGGTLLTRVLDQNGTAVPGARVRALGAESYSANTNSKGCTIFGGMAVSSYYVLADKANWVDINGSVQAVNGAATSASTPVTKELTIGQAGEVTGSFNTKVDPPGASPLVTLANQNATSLSWFSSGSPNGSMTSPGRTALLPLAQTISTTKKLFPFITGSAGTYTDNYGLWAGRCPQADPPSPPTTNRTAATVGPNQTVARTIAMPGLIVSVNYTNGSGTTTAVRPDHIKLTDFCGNSWTPAVRTPADPGNAYGQLDPNHVGQPFAPAAAPYTLCVDYDPPGAGGPYRTPAGGSAPTTQNDNFSIGTTKALSINTTVGGLC